MLRRTIGALVDAAGRRPYVVLLLSAIFFFATWGYAAELRNNLRTDFFELLPRDSPGFKAFEHQLGRVGGGATFLVAVESPNRKANERFVDDISADLLKKKADRDACVQTCGPKSARCIEACGPDDIAYLEAGTKDLEHFFEVNKWLYADAKDLSEADDTLDHQIAIKSGLVDDLDAPDSKGKPSAPSSESKPALGMDEHYERWKKESRKHDDFPTGYFATTDGTTMVVRIISNASGTGGGSGDRFMAEMTKRVADMNVTTKYDPQMRVGFAGDIPNAVAEKDSILGEAVWASGIAFALILGGIIVWYRSPWSLAIVFAPAFLGVGGAYAFARFAIGYLNAPGAFLGAIILGNGINYPIVLFARYREFRARGIEPEEARREAVLNAFRAELVGASVASIAYGSLTITQFRGFSQFGLIGFVGMLFVWASIIPVVPALIVITERIQARMPAFLGGPKTYGDAEGSSGALMRFLAKATTRRPLPFVIVPIVLTVIAATRVPSFLRDPWEYDFSHLGSKSSKQGGAGDWSNRADAVFQGKQNISGTLILADKVAQVPDVKAKILASDAADPKGKLIDEIVTVNDFLPGTRAEQDAKLAILARIRERLSERVLHDVSDSERARLLEMRPPENLRVLEPKDLPSLIRRRFEETNGTIGTVMYIKYKFGVSFSDGHVLLRMAKTTDNVELRDGTIVRTASRSTVFAEMIRSMERDGPLATGASFLAVMIVVLLATHTRRGAFAVLLALIMGVTLLVGGAAIEGTRLNFFNFIALPITFGIGCEYPFNVYDRVRLLNGDVRTALARTGGAVLLCSYTTIVGYGSMYFSDNQALQSFGMLALFGEVACVSMALLFLPALLQLLGGAKAKADGPS